MNPSTIWIFSIEPLENRYTKQWHENFPILVKDTLNGRSNVIQVDGIQKNSSTTEGAFLNFSDTNYWKSTQLCNFLEYYNSGGTSPNDQFIFTDAWNPTIIQLKYMKDLLGLNWKIHGLWHSGSYDNFDFLGRLVGSKPWVRFAEKSFFEAIDHNYFATDFHINLFCKNLLNIDWIEIERLKKIKKIIRTGWPMEYMEQTLTPYKNIEKRDLILFPHRIAPEKQVEIFKDIEKQLPQYEFVVCQEKKLSKHEYHTLLAQSKIIFSASLQETLGIGCYEGCILNSIPLVPNRLSYKEMYFECFTYPEEWSNSFKDYLSNRDKICDLIDKTMINYHKLLPSVKQQSKLLTEEFFSATDLLDQINYSGIVETPTNS